MLVALDAGEAVTVDQRVAVGAEWDDALIDLYRAQRLPLLRLAVLLTDDPGVAEDVVQDAFVALQRRWHAVDPAAAAGSTACQRRCRARKASWTTSSAVPRSSVSSTARRSSGCRCAR